MNLKQNKPLIKLIASASALLLIFLISLVVFLVTKNTSRKVFIYESLDDTEYHTEVYHLPKIKNDEQIHLFIDDLLLGPVHDRYRPLFAQGTKVLSCIQRGKTLYLDLSEEALLQQGTSSQTKTACELLKTNILTNFSNIKDVILFIKGTEVYKNNNFEDLS